MAFAINREELAWAAGFFDGEGHTALGVRSKRSAMVHMQTTQNDRAVLEKFQGFVGGAGRIYPRSNGADWSWQTTSTPEGVFVAALLWHWLSPPKRAQIAARFRRVREYPYRGSRDTTRCARGHLLTPDNVYVWAKRPTWRSCRECRRLNHRGSHGSVSD
jgi:hypothetical protein